MPKLNLTTFQKKVLLYFGQNKFGQNFYWTGGTLLSYYYLHHRKSVDLDFFSEDLYHDDEYLIFINNLKKDLKINKVLYEIKNNRRLLVLKKGEQTLKLELVFFPFPGIKKRQVLKKFKVKIDSLEDIMINKVLSTYQRNEVKDVYDLFFYLKNKPKYNLSQLVGLVEKKFGVSIDISLFVTKVQKLLADFKNIEPLLINNKKDLKKQITSFFESEFNRSLRI